LVFQFAKTTRTLHGGLLSTVDVTLPRTARRKLLAAVRPITMMSAELRVAAETISTAGTPNDSSTVTRSSGIPSSLAREIHRSGFALSLFAGLVAR
jgi:hypothetical protein